MLTISLELTYIGCCCSCCWFSGGRNTGSLGDGRSNGGDFEGFQVEFCVQRAKEDGAEVVQTRTGRTLGATVIFQQRDMVLE